MNPPETIGIPGASRASPQRETLLNGRATIHTTSSAPALFSVGEKVRIAERYPVGHYRTPMYVRGKMGRVERVLPTFLNPEQEGYGRNAGKRVRLYRVRIPQTDLWPDYQGHPADELQIEIYEHWLEPA